MDAFVQLAEKKLVPKEIVDDAKMELEEYIALHRRASIDGEDVAADPIVRTEYRADLAGSGRQIPGLDAERSVVVHDVAAAKAFQTVVEKHRDELPSQFVTEVSASVKDYVRQRMSRIDSKVR